MSNCGICKAVISRHKVDKIECVVCNYLFHWNCVNITAVEFELIKNKWFCKNCVAERRTSRRLSDSEPNMMKPAEKSPPSQTDVITLLTELSKKVSNISESQNRLEKDINVSINNCHEKVEEVKKLVQVQNDIINKQQDIIQQLTTENKKLNKEMNEVKEDLDAALQESRSNVVEIHGLPINKGETLMSVISKLAAVLHFTLTSDMIDKCFQLKKSLTHDWGTVIIKFLRKEDKDNFIKSKKVKRDLNTGHLGHQQSTPIYINESLTPVRKKVYANARKFKKDEHWDYCWVKSGKIYLRKTSESKIFSLTKQSHLDSIMKPITQTQ
ncbi:hypothetical protein RI129_004342 [Pyrocoelia pectoralis]|uniref:Zinc finger PHD-type domain-containing protein n=1 Tax=Pyrocoelia pectoralis TaxID=417401 RepID=A0AAN7ZPZ3_9COLE